MIDLRTEKRITDFVLWLFAPCVLVILLTSCSPFVPGSIATATATDAPTVTATVLHATVAPLPFCHVATGYSAGALNLRTGPGTTYAVIRVLTEAERLTVLTHGRWLKVETTQHVTG